MRICGVYKQVSTQVPYIAVMSLKSFFNLLLTPTLIGFNIFLQENQVVMQHTP